MRWDFSGVVERRAGKQSSTSVIQNCVEYDNSDHNRKGRHDGQGHRVARPNLVRRVDLKMAQETLRHANVRIMLEV
jgi:hypothetical protein